MCSELPNELSDLGLLCYKRSFVITDLPREFTVCYTCVYVPYIYTYTPIESNTVSVSHAH